MWFPSMVYVALLLQCKSSYISAVAILTEWAGEPDKTPPPTFSSAPQMLPKAFLLLYGSRQSWTNSS